MSENKLTRYEILSERYEGQLINEVNLKINQGWEPLGRPFIHPASNGPEHTKFFQAMIKRSSLS